MRFIDINVIICAAVHAGNERLFFFYWYYMYVQGLVLITYSLYPKLLMLFFQDKAITYVSYIDFRPKALLSLKYNIDYE